MAKQGYKTLTVEDELVQTIDTIKTQEMCRTRPETLRLLVRSYRQMQNHEEINSEAWIRTSDHPVQAEGSLAYAT